MVTFDHRSGGKTVRNHPLTPPTVYAVDSAYSLHHTAPGSRSWYFLTRFQTIPNVFILQWLWRFVCLFVYSAIRAPWTNDTYIVIIIDCDHDYSFLNVECTTFEQVLWTVRLYISLYSPGCYMSSHRNVSQSKSEQCRKTLCLTLKCTDICSTFSPARRSNILFLFGSIWVISLNEYSNNVRWRKKKC